MLGNDVLHDYDIDLDLPHFVIRLYQGRPCQGRLPGWTSVDGVSSFTQRPHGHHVIVPVEVAGQPAAALLDTGADVTSLDRELARRAGVPDVQMTDNMRMHMFGFGASQVTGTFNEVSSLDLPGEHLAPYDVAVFDPALRMSGLDWDMLLGEDYWQNHKAWISYATGKVYFAHSW